MTGWACHARAPGMARPPCSPGRAAAARRPEPLRSPACPPSSLSRRPSTPCSPTAPRPPSDRWSRPTGRPRTTCMPCGCPRRADDSASSAPAAWPRSWPQTGCAHVRVRGSWRWAPGWTGNSSAPPTTRPCPTAPTPPRSRWPWPTSGSTTAWGPCCWSTCCTRHASRACAPSRQTPSPATGPSTRSSRISGFGCTATSTRVRSVFGFRWTRGTSTIAAPWRSGGAARTWRAWCRCCGPARSRWSAPRGGPARSAVRSWRRSGRAVSGARCGPSIPTPSGSGASWRTPGWANCPVPPTWQCSRCRPAWWRAPPRSVARRVYVPWSCSPPAWRARTRGSCCTAAVGTACGSSVRTVWASR